MKHFLATLLLFCLSFYPLSAQRYQFKKYKIEEGLVSNETFAIIQDSQHRIWISSTGGISCFNGNTFTNYTTENGLASNIVFSIFEDSKGRIWAGTLDNGVSIIENGTITNPKGINFRGLGTITDILEGKDGTIYIVFSKGIATYKDGKFAYLLKSTQEQVLAGLQTAAWFDDNTMYIASLENGLYKLTLNPLQVENVFNENNGVNNICYTVQVDGKKNIWVGAYGELNKIADGKLTNYKFDPKTFDQNRVYGILEEGEDQLLLCFEGNGFGFFDKASGTLKIINDAQGLPSPYIYKAIKDTEGNYWMTSYGEGIIRFRGTAYKIYDDTQGLPSKSVNAAVEWNGQKILGTNEGVVILETDGKLTPISPKKPIKHLVVTPQNTLLYTTPEAVWELPAAHALPKLIDEGDYNLIYRKDVSTYLCGRDQIKVLEKDSTYFIDSRRSIAMAPIGNRMIMCKVSGLFQLQGTRIDTIPGLFPKIHNNFRSLDNINSNEIMAASEKKLYHISLNDDQFETKVFDMARFKHLKHLRALQVDGENLWLAGRDMIVKANLPLLLEKDSLVAQYYPTVPHFLENDVDFNSLLVTRDKKLLATSLSGLLELDPGDYHPNTQAPKLDLSQILLFSEPLADSLYQTPKGLVLPYRKNYLTFMMEAITFTRPDQVRYKYRMTGLRDGDEWSQPTQDPKVVFSYLPPGNYTFEFTADNGNGVWQPQPYQYPFVIKLPFWLTWQFWVITVSILALSIFIFYYITNRAKQKRNEIYTQNLIKAQEEERTRVARELHDSVGQKLMLLTKKTKTTGNLEMASLAGNTLDELRAISRGLHPTTLARLGLTAAIINLIDEVDSNSNIFFTREIENIDALLGTESALHLYRIIQEVLNNMVKHSEAQAASVVILNKDNQIETIISDNGKGFELAEKVKTSDSLGMKTLMERAKILRSKIEIKTQPTKGTTVILNIPL